MVALAAGLATWAAPSFAQDPASSGHAHLKEHVSYLASPELEGRASGSPGKLLARDYIARTMEAIGLEPADPRGFCTSFEAVTSSEPSPSGALHMGQRVLASKIDFIPAGFSDVTPFEGEVVFAGYGIHRPDLGYDDFEGLDVKGRIVVALSGAPPALAEAVLHEAKAAYALSVGARALLLINGPEDHGHRADQRTDDLPAPRPAAPLEGLPVAHLTARAGQAILESAGLDLTATQRRILAEGKPQSQTLNLAVRGEFPIQRARSLLYNCIARLPGNPSDPTRAPILLGAHYDGLGMGSVGSFHDHGPAFHPGADDNASGVAVLLEVARKMVQTNAPRTRDVYFVALAGEEIGLIGSRRLAQQWVEQHLTDEQATDDAPIYINLDMVGRLRNGRIHVATGNPKDSLPATLSRAAVTAQLAINFEPLQSRYSDHLAFFDAGFIVMNLTTGRHGDYHLPSDTIDRIEWRGMARLVTLLVETLELLAD